MRKPGAGFEIIVYFLNIFRCLDIRGFLSQRLQFSVALNPPIMSLSCHRIITLY